MSRPILVAIAGSGVFVGLLARAADSNAWASAIWTGVTLPVLAALVVEIVTRLRRGDVGLDMVAAVSMSGALALNEPLAAAVVAVMYAGGQSLESVAQRRAGREMTALLARAPRAATRQNGEALEEVPLEAVLPGDRLIVRQGEIVPVDGIVASRIAVLDESALTGEPLPVERRCEQAVLSGSTNVGAAFYMSATRLAADSTYAGIIRLVAAAQLSKAPMARLADRFAVGFLAFTLALAGSAWLWTADPIRALAVLVVATPCPLILAVPVALISGVSRAAAAGILVKGGGALEALATVRTLVVDKTGTLTYGTARLVASRFTPDWTPHEILRLAASLDQASKHVIAETLVSEARRRRLRLAIPVDAVETPGEGIEGVVEGRALCVGGLAFVARRARDKAELCNQQNDASGAAEVAVAIDGDLAGVLVFSDAVRDDAAPLLNTLRRLGIRRIVLASGDRRDAAEAVARDLAIDAVFAELTPEQKTAIVVQERGQAPVMMVGDGVNDAPALAASDVGVAMGATGAAASAEAADVVILVDRLDRLLPAVQIARGARRIALQSVYAGLGLSAVGMMVAAAGFLTPVQGALIQEAIDVAVILNALRALRVPAAAPEPRLECMSEPGPLLPEVPAAPGG